MVFKKKKSGCKKLLELYRYIFESVLECLINSQKLKQCKKKEIVRVINKNFLENEDTTKFFLKNW